MDKIAVEEKPVSTVPRTLPRTPEELELAFRKSYNDNYNTSIDPSAPEVYYKPKGLADVLRRQISSLYRPSDLPLSRVPTKPQMFNISPTETPDQIKASDRILRLADQVDEKYNITKGLELNEEPVPLGYLRGVGSHAKSTKQIGIYGLNELAMPPAEVIDTAIHELTHAHQAQDPAYNQLTAEAGKRFMEIFKIPPPADRKGRYLAEPEEIGARLVAAELVHKALGAIKYKDPLLLYHAKNEAKKELEKLRGLTLDK